MTDSSFRLFQIIEYLAKSKDWVSLRIMSRDLHISAAAVYRMLTSLEEIGYVRQHPEDSKYQLTLKIAWISAQVLDNIQLRSVAHPFMTELATLTNETTHLAVLQDTEFVYIDKVDHSQSIRMRSRIGQRGKLICTAVGKSILAFLPPDELERVLSHLKFEANTPNTITDVTKFREHLCLVREQGYAVDDEENEVGIRCLGAPIFDHMGELAGAMSISGWTISMTPERVLNLAPELISVCMKISRELGYNGSKQEER